MAALSRPLGGMHIGLIDGSLVPMFGDGSNRQVGSGRGVGQGRYFADEAQVIAEQNAAESAGFKTVDEYRALITSTRNIWAAPLMVASFGYLHRIISSSLTSSVASRLMDLERGYRASWEGSLTWCMGSIRFLVPERLGNGACAKGHH